MILADGCFDPLHVGHLRYLRAASVFGRVVVRVAPDEEIRAKGRQPFQTVDERMELIRALGYTAFTSQTLADAIYNLSPSVLIKGDDWQGRMPAEVRAACAHNSTKMRFTQTTSRTSTERLSV